VRGLKLLVHEASDTRDLQVSAVVYTEAPRVWPLCMPLGGGRFKATVMLRASKARRCESVRTSECGACCNGHVRRA
jgi:hypothetical protein